MKHWTFGQWLTYGPIGIAAILLAADGALRNSSALSKLTPFINEPLWMFTPAVLVAIAAATFILRSWRERPSVESAAFPPCAVRYEQQWDFMLVPKHFSVDLAAEFPHIEVTLYAVSFLPRPIRITEVDLSVRVHGKELEGITFRQKDWQADPRSADVVFCRRNLTDLERAKIPWQAGAVFSASYQLSAKATDGTNTFAYTVSAKSIDGWVNVPTGWVPTTAR